MSNRSSRTILISGVSSGLGAALAQRFRGRGDRVLGLSRRPPVDAAVLWRATDVSDPAAVRLALEELLPGGARLDVVVCGAGVGLLGSIEDTPIEAVRAVFAVNYFGVVNLVKAVLPRLRSQRASMVLIIGSLSGRVPLPFQAHYAASKAAIESFSFALRCEVAPWGIDVVLIDPGDVRTGFEQAMLRPPCGESPYRPLLESCASVVRADMEAAPAEGDVVDLVERVLCTPNPRPRYAVGPSTWRVALARRILPDWLNLRLIRHHFRV